MADIVDKAPDMAAQLFRLYKAELEKVWGRPVLNRELAGWLGIHEVTVSELLSGNRKKIDVTWLIKLMVQLPERQRYQPFESLLASEQENALWERIRALGRPVNGEGVSLPQRLVSPNLRLGMGADGGCHISRGEETVYVPAQAAAQLLVYLSGPMGDGVCSSSD